MNHQATPPLNKFSSSYNEFSFKKSPSKQPYFGSYQQDPIYSHTSEKWLDSSSYSQLKKIPDLYSNLRQTINTYSNDPVDLSFEPKPYERNNNEFEKKYENTPSFNDKKEDYLRNTINFTRN